jgi:hypothetical protein
MLQPLGNFAIAETAQRAHHMVTIMCSTVFASASRKPRIRVQIDSTRRPMERARLVRVTLT